MQLLFNRYLECSLLQLLSMLNIIDGLFQFYVKYHVKYMYLVMYLLIAKIITFSTYLCDKFIEIK